MMQLHDVLERPGSQRRFCHCDDFAVSDETAAGVGPQADTELVPPVTMPAPELAWSSEEPATELLSQRSWGSVWSIAGVGFLLAVVVAVSMMAFAAWSDRPTAAPAGVPYRPPTAALPPARALPPPLPAPSPPTPRGPRPLQRDSRGVPMLPKDPTADEQRQVLTAILDRDGIPYSSPQAAAIDADSICEYLDNDHRTGPQLFAWVRRTHPGLEPEQVGGFAGASIGTYCRQYGFLLDPANETATS